jgi:3-oxoacyl-[acyl-carrier-protein] synthase II
VKKRVVITGLGTVNPLGLSVQETWNKILRSESGVATIASFDTSLCPITIAAEVKNFDPTQLRSQPLYPYGKSQHPDDSGTEPLLRACHQKDLKRYGRFIHLALAAGVEAYEDSGLDLYRNSSSEFDATRVGINIGVGMGGLPEMEEVHSTFLQKGYKRITPFFITQIIPNLASGALSLALNFKGPNLCNTTACTSSAHSIGESFELILRGSADIMFAGGAESAISPLGIGGFAAMKALSSRNHEPTQASRPFDQDRDGFVMGEGSAVLVLEELEHALKRGAKIYGEIIGYGVSSDAYHLTTPAPEGEGGARAMKNALQSAGISAELIDYVNTHGTSTPAGDVEEAKAVAKLVESTSSQPHQKPVYISSTKSMTGHLLGAAGAIEALFCTLALKEGVLPATLNLDRLDPALVNLPLNFVAHQAQPAAHLHYALSNSFGFGGTNASLILKKWVSP